MRWQSNLVEVQRTEEGHEQQEADLPHLSELDQTCTESNAIYFSISLDVKYPVASNTERRPRADVKPQMYKCGYVELLRFMENFINMTIQNLSCAVGIPTSWEFHSIRQNKSLRPGALYCQVLSLTMVQNFSTFYCLYCIIYYPKHRFSHEIFTRAYFVINHLCNKSHFPICKFSRRASPFFVNILTIQNDQLCNIRYCSLPHLSYGIVAVKIILMSNEGTGYVSAP